MGKRIIVKSRILEFISKQHKDRPIKMGESKSYDECGCLMVQFAKEELDIAKDFSCGWASINDDYTLSECVDEMFPLTTNENLTYGELRERIANEEIRKKAGV